MAETLLEKAKRLGIQPAGQPVSTSVAPKSESLLEKAARLGIKPENAPKKQDGLLKTIIKDPIKTLLVKPADRFAEAVGRTGVLGSTIKQGYEAQFDAGESRTFGGVEIEPQKAFGQGGGAQIVGDAAKITSYLYGGPKLPPIVAGGLKGKILQSGIQGVKAGGPSGALYGFGEGIQKEGATLGGVAKDTLIGGGLGLAGGALLGGATPIAVKGASAVRTSLANRAAKAAGEADHLIGTIIQGEAKDIPAAAKAFREIDTEGINTYTKLKEALNTKIKAGSEKLREGLGFEPYVKPLDELALTTKVGDADVSHNFVNDAMDQLEKLYKKTNNVKGMAEIQQLRQKALREGLTLQELNDLAIKHGQDLTGFNANGELASGLGKQAAENTRKGIKETARKQFNDPVYNETDEALSGLIKTRDLVENIEEAALKLRQKSSEVGIGTRVGQLIEQVLNFTTFGVSRGVLQSVRDTGIAKAGRVTLDALDLEKVLAKNLKRLTEIADGPAETMLQKLEKFLLDNKVMPKTPAKLNTKKPKLDKKPAKLKKDSPSMGEIDSAQQAIAKGMTEEQYVKGQGDVSRPTELTFKKSVLPIEKIKAVGTKDSFDPYSLAYSKAQLKSGKLLEPIEVRLEKGKYVIQDGEHRFQAYTELGIKQIPVKILDDLPTTSQLRAEYQTAKGALPKPSSAQQAIKDSLTEEQYVKGHQSIYRADSQAFNAKLVKPDGNTPGTYFATNKSYATDYANGGRKVSEYFVRKDAKILKYNDLPLELQKKPTLTKDTAFESKRIYDYAKSKGYDAVQSEVPTKVNKNTAELTVINPDVVKTTSQLRTEYQAAKGLSQLPPKPGKLNKGSASVGALAAGAIGLGALSALSTPSTTNLQQVEQAPSFNKEDFTTRIVNIENEALATSTPEKLYASVGVTGDLGKYQVSPSSLAVWSKPWVGRLVTKSEFLRSPELQEKFWGEYLNVVERLQLTPEESAVAWHTGWGQLGKGSRETRDQRFRDKLAEKMNSKIGQAYLAKFNNQTK